MSPDAGRLMLVGAGRVHLIALAALARKRIAPVTLVSPWPQYLHSGMVAGYIAGRYTIDELTVDLPAMMQRIGGHFRQGTVQRLDPAARTATLEYGSTLSWEVASVAIGGLPGGSGIPGLREHAKLIKPVAQLLELRAALDDAARAAGPEPLQVVVVGAGAAGVELVLAVRARLDQQGANRAIISLVDSTHTPIRDQSPAARQAAEVALGKAEITLRLSTAVEEVGLDYVRLTGGRVLPVDLVVWAAGMEPPTLFSASGLPTDSHGFLTVEDTLAVPGCRGLFGGGAAVSLQGNPRAARPASSPMRQGRVLARNLAIAIRGSGTRPYATYAAPPRSRLLLNLSDGSAMASRGELVTTSSLGMNLKDWTDRRFVRRFQQLSF